MPQTRQDGEGFLLVVAAVLQLKEVEKSSNIQQSATQKSG